MTLLGAMSRSVCTRTIQDTYRSTIRFELRELAYAQEDYHAIHGRYASSVPELRAEVKFSSTSLVVTTIDRAGKDAWSASATSEKLPRWTCTANQALSHPRCTQQTTWAERNIPKPTFGTMLIEYWLIALSLWRRLRRAEAIAMT